MKIHARRTTQSPRGREEHGVAAKPSKPLVIWSYLNTLWVRRDMTGKGTAKT